MREWRDILNQVDLSMDEAEESKFDLTIEIVELMLKRREQFDMSQRQLSRESGISQATIARLEKFGNMPRIDTLIKLLGPLKLAIKIVEID